MGNKLILGVNDLESFCKQNNKLDLLKEWDTKKNPMLPSQITYGSNKYVWWRCNLGHSYETRISNKIMLGTGCPFCSGKKILKGFNDLKTLNPELSTEWNYSKNGSLKPDMVTSGSNEKVWWVCSKGHEWKSSISHRTISKRGCPYCTNQKVLEGFNDLKTTNPELLHLWDYEKNKDLLPTMVMKGSRKKVWWLECGHHWQATLNDISSGRRCPICRKETRTSFQEQAILYYVKKCFPDVINGDRNILLGKELDIFIPSLRVAIEYDGRGWHKDTQKDIQKNKLCEENNIFLYRIREKSCSVLPSMTNIHIFYVDDNSLDSLQEAICSLLKLLGHSVDIDIDRDRSEIYSQYVLHEKNESLIIINPALAKEWNYEKNGDVRPENVKAGSSKKVWWKCANGHEWQATIGGRHGQNLGCPICSGRAVLEGYNDLSTINPSIAAEWDYDKNINLSPSKVTLYSNKSVWWKCKNNHSWKDTVTHRATGRGCPFCSGKRIISGENDFGTLYPNLLEEWDYDKNTILPSQIRPKTHKKVWWICSKGHSYESTIANRTYGKGCPYCSGNHKRTVKNIETGEIFESLSEAQRKTGINNIRICCANAKRTAGGYHWEYVDTAENDTK